MKDKIKIYSPGRLFVILSFIIVPLGEGGLTSRITLPDVILVLALLLLLGRKKIYNPGLAPTMILIISFLLTVFFSPRPDFSLIEVLILFFLMLCMLVTYNTYKDNLRLIFLDVSRAVTLSLLVGLSDYFSSKIGLPRMFPTRAPGEIVSAFRNAGQAGAYILVMLAILLPVRLSSLKNSFTAKEMTLINIGVVSGIIFLFISGKVAAYIGFFAGIVFLNIAQRNLKALFATIFMAGVFSLIYYNLEDISPEMNNRIQRKIETRITRNVDGTNDITEEGFVADNMRNSFKAFNDNPLAGSGIGAFTVEYARHEVHSTYFKMIGETGMLGIIGYTVFFIYLIKQIRYKPGINNFFQGQLWEYKKILFPLFLGCAVSWSYTYHLRKREFWIMLSIILIINSFMKDSTKFDSALVDAEEAEAEEQQ